MREELLDLAEALQGVGDADEVFNHLLCAVVLGAEVNLIGRQVDVPELSSGHIGYTVMAEILPGKVYYYWRTRQLYAMAPRTVKGDPERGERGYKSSAVVPLYAHPDWRSILLDPALIAAARQFRW